MAYKFTLFIAQDGTTCFASAEAVETMEEGWIAVGTYPVANEEHEEALLRALVQPLTAQELIAWREEARHTR